MKFDIHDITEGIMSEQGRTDQETGAPPPDPATPSQSSELPEGAGDQGQAQPKSPDEDPQGEAREGGGPTHAKGSVGGEEDEDEDN